MGMGIGRQPMMTRWINLNEANDLVARLRVPPGRRASCIEAVVAEIDGTVVGVTIVDMPSPTGGPVWDGATARVTMAVDRCATRRRNTHNIIGALSSRARRAARRAGANRMACAVDDILWTKGWDWMGRDVDCGGIDYARVAVIGGLSRATNQWEAAGVGLGVEIEHHDGNASGRGAGEIVAAVRRADFVVIITDLNSHNGVGVARQAALASNKRHVLVKRLSPDGLSACLASASGGDQHPRMWLGVHLGVSA